MIYIKYVSWHHNSCNYKIMVLRDFNLNDNGYKLFQDLEDSCTGWNVNLIISMNRVEAL